MTRISALSKSNVFSSFESLSLFEFVVDGPESLAQMQDCAMLTRKQRIHTHARLLGNLLEAVTHQLVGDEYLALLLRQLVEGLLQFLQQYASSVGRLGSSIWRRKYVFQQERL